MLAVPKVDRRKIMLVAKSLGMTTGDYVFFTIDMLPEEELLNPKNAWFEGDSEDEDARDAFESVFHVNMFKQIIFNVSYYK